MEAPLPRPKKAEGNPHNDDRNCSAASDALEKFAWGLCANETSAKPDFRLQSLFSPDIADDAVVLTIPALDLKIEANKQEVLPTLGQHASANMTEEGKPDMAASVFAKAKESPKEIEDQKAVESIAKKISWTKSTVPYASSAVALNVSGSFKTLLNSRLKSWTLLLLRHSLSTGSTKSRSQLLGMLSSKIEIITSEVKFKTLALPNAAAGIKPKDSDAVLPLLFEASVQISIQEKQEHVILKAPGTISGNYGWLPCSGVDSQPIFVTALMGTIGLRLVNVKLDAKMMMKAMVDQSRLVVLQAVSAATCTTPDVLVAKERGPKTPETSNVFPLPKKRPPSKGSLVGSEAPTKTTPTTNQSPQDHKAMTSALRIDNILQGKTQSVPLFSSRLRAAVAGGIAKRKNGPTLGALTPQPKKSRIAQSAAKLKSFKSFGRPHGGDMGSGPNNATFGEFGSGHSGIWGRDGRLAAHPQPFRAGKDADKNATFGESTTKFAAVMGAAMLDGGISKSRSPTSSFITRTPTALESSLMKKLAR